MKKLFIFTFLFTIAFTAAAQNSRSLHGNWQGHISIMGNQLPITTRFTGDDSLRGTIDIQGATLPLQNIRKTEADSVFFQFTTNVNTARFKGTFKNDSTITGHYYQAGQQFRFNLKQVDPKAHQQRSNNQPSFKPSKKSHDAALAGNWKGAIESSVPLRIKTYFKKLNDGLKGTLEIQGVTLPLQNISSSDGDSVHFELQSSNGLATFKGSLTSDSSIAGHFKQKGFTFPFKLHRFEPDTVAAKAKDKPKPYHHKDLVIKNDSIDIGGTLTWPENEQASQLVIMISGSGAQDRDETTAVTDFKPFATLADSLTMAGIATFRYDDRGIGESTGDFGDTTLDMLASDVETIIHYYKNDADQQFDQIILLGHSQGGVVGGKVAAENKGVDKLILMASTGVKLKKVSDFQVREAIKRGGLNNSQIEQEMAARSRLISALHKQENIVQAKQRYTKDHLTLLQSLSDSTVSSEKLREAAQKEMISIVAAFSNPQFKSLLFYDPANDLKKMDIPVLALFGGKDTQVSVAMNKKPIESALTEAGVPHQIKILDNANHLFQKAETGQVDEYGTLPSQFVKGFISTIINWTKQDY